MTAGKNRRAERIDYAELMRKAVLSLLRDVLSDVAERGLPGRHHFYISFATDAAGVVMPEALRKKAPGEMTIALQHRFENLEVSDEGFSVTLWFGGAAERVSVPFDALISFADPAAGFALGFDELGARGASSDEATEKDKDKEKEQEASDKKPQGPAEVIALDSFRKGRS